MACWRRSLLLLSVGLLACSRQGFGVPTSTGAADGGAMDHGARDAAPGAAEAGSPDAGDAAIGGDAGLPRSCTNLADETPCDDRDICSPSSRCRAGVCHSSNAPSSCTVADSRADYGNVQGGEGWWYGYWHGEIDPDGAYDASTDVEQMVVHPNDSWHPADDDTNPTWCYLATYWEHPGGHPLKAPVRRWVSDVAGPALIQLKFNMGDTGGGDGARKTVYVDGVEVWSKQVAGTDGTVYEGSVPVTLELGTRVDFLLHPVDSDAQDTCNFEVTIVSP